MFDQIMAAKSKPTTQYTFDHAQRMMDCTLRLTQSQMDVMKGLYDDVGQEFSKTMSSAADPATMAKSWPQLMSVATRANAEAGALFMKNAQEYQRELLQMMQSANPGLPGQFMNDLMGIAKTATIANGGAALQAARAKKAA
jgi:hypothetical protein